MRQFCFQSQPGRPVGHMTLPRVYVLPCVVVVTASIAQGIAQRLYVLLRIFMHCSSWVVRESIVDEEILVKNLN